MIRPKRKYALRFRKYPQDQLQRVYKFLQECQQKHSYTPTQTEVAHKFHTYHSLVQHWYRLMEEQKMMERVPGTRRRFKLLPLQETQPIAQEA